MILADYHTHTKYSHGKGTIYENVMKAREMGLKQIAITDHGLNHIVFGLRPWKIKEMRNIIDGLNEKYSDIKVLLGVEANLISLNGDTDVWDKYKDQFDIVLCGFHKLVWAKSFASQFSFIGKNDFLQFVGKNDGQALKKKNTQALIKCVMSGGVDVLSHPNHDMLIDCVEVAKACRDYGVYFEINSKKVHMEEQTLCDVANTGVQFLVNSDAHSVDRVGDFTLALDMVEKCGISTSQIANFNRLPTLPNRAKV